MKRYYITDRRSIGGLGPLLGVIRQQLALGVDYLQIREKDLEARAVFELVMETLAMRGQIQPAVRTRILVNSRADIALAAEADGVHLPAAAPRSVPPGLLVARSCHTLQEVQDARDSKIDLVTFSPVFTTPLKGEPQGIKQLEFACRLNLPVFALGGVTWDNAPDCIRAGCAGVAGIRLFQNQQL